MIELPLLTAVCLWFVVRTKGIKAVVPILMWVLYAVIETGFVG